MSDRGTRLGRSASRNVATDNHVAGRSKSQLLLLVLTVEKVIQHLFVTYAFAVDLGDIRASVVIHHVPLMIVGFAVGLLFGVSARLQLKNRRAGFVMLLFLALFDFVSEFVAQGTLAIEIVLSIVVATIILLTLFFNRKTLLRPRPRQGAHSTRRAKQ